MKFLSIDLETTGLNPEYCQILEVGAVIGDLTDTPVEALPHFHCYVQHERIVGEPYALAMNQRILESLAKCHAMATYCPNHQVWPALKHFIFKYLSLAERVTLAGKNVMSFDLRFLRRLPQFEANSFHHRALDPASMYWEASDTELPSTETCLKRAGLEPVVTHRAIDDARDVVRLVRAYWKG